MANEQWSAMVTMAWVAAVAASLGAGGAGAALRRKDVFFRSLSLAGLLCCLAPALGVDAQIEDWRRALAPRQRVQFPRRIPPAPPMDPLVETITAPPLAAPRPLAGPEGSSLTDADADSETATAAASRTAGSEDLRPLGPPGQRAVEEPARATKAGPPVPPR